MRGRTGCALGFFPAASEEAYTIATGLADVVPKEAPDATALRLLSSPHTCNSSLYFHQILHIATGHNTETIKPRLGEKFAAGQQDFLENEIAEAVIIVEVLHPAKVVSSSHKLTDVHGTLISKNKANVPVYVVLG